MPKPVRTTLKSLGVVLILLSAQGCANVSPPAPVRSIPCETIRPYEGPVTEWAVDFEIAREVACGG